MFWRNSGRSSERVGVQDATQMPGTIDAFEAPRRDPFETCAQAAQRLWNLIRDDVQFPDYDKGIGSNIARLETVVTERPTPLSILLQKTSNTQRVMVDLIRKEGNNGAVIWSVLNHHIWYDKETNKAKCQTDIYPIVPGGRIFYCTSESVGPCSIYDDFREDPNATEFTPNGVMTPDMCTVLTRQFDAIADSATFATPTIPDTPTTAVA